MEKTPLSLRKHIAIFGNVNSGKSTLFNALIGQDVAIVSNVKGTTTDPVTKSMELIPYGPVAVIDTAGLSDDTELGAKRIEKTKDILKRTDLIIYTKDINSDEEIIILDNNIPFIPVYTKCDTASESVIIDKKKTEPNAVFLYNADAENLEKLKLKMIEELEKLNEESETLIGDLVEKNGSVVLVIPIDSAAPKGRIILPQVQVLRDCLDHDIKAYVTKETTLKEALDDLKKVDLVVTDSQAFKLVSEIVPREIPLTSFSMLLARQKGNFNQLLDGISAVRNLKDNDTVLVLEGCTHNTTHEDIGRIKIPAGLQKKLGIKLNFEYYTAYDFPKDLSRYSLAIQCGGCMINKKEINSRLKIMKENSLSVTNYGIILAYLNGILDRASEIFGK